MKPALGAILALTSGSSRWQERQTFSCSTFREAASPVHLSAVRGFVWQEMQSGAPVSPWASAFPCAESLKAAGHRLVAVPARDHLPRPLELPSLPRHGRHAVGAVALLAGEPFLASSSVG